MGLLQIIGLASLLHAGYSSYEFTHLQKSHSIDLPFPKDITLEVIISLLILTFDLFFQSTPSKLSLINNDVIKSEYRLKPILMKDAVVEDEKLGAGPFKFIESRTNFIDINAKRREFAEWAGDQGDNEDKKEELKKELDDLTGENKKTNNVKPVESKPESKEETKVDVSKEEPPVIETEQPAETIKEQPKSTNKKNGKKNNKKSKKV
ncbi:putative secreted protein [Wickerhamomyces ciferrii]|uniref:Secreted protein n=1 Tax=Wickerhamomyces ciferrii (strain ATCC 14091 / BCRC 22168 / CBS 111 / JCM 3599 / NBRC 0793 / NRRL Y-1031 F-60-10) TaxID=1206466 RepID=K0KYY8_WICCF|nr:uncharacterized protein BN7_5880 [Wickerhamomyces ciferrii]CCH46288.1 putative secreted protein [Wickerhamomyces ciferrii]